MFDSKTRSSCRVRKELVLAETADIVGEGDDIVGEGDGIVGEGDGVRSPGLSVLHGAGLETEEFDSEKLDAALHATAGYMGAIGAGGVDAGSLGNMVVVSGAMLNCADAGS